MKNSQIKILIALVLLIPVVAAAKQKKETSIVFDAPADRLYGAVYKYAQHHGTLKYSSDKHMAVSTAIHIPEGKWSYRKDFDCTISAEPSEDNKSVVDIVGLPKTKHTTVNDVFRKGPAAKVIDGIRKELEQQKRRQLTALS
jgi:hypothetical protein